MNKNKILFKNIFIKNNSFSHQKIKEDKTYNTHLRNIKLSKKNNYSLTGIKDKTKTELHKDNNPYLFTEIKSKDNINYFQRIFTPENGSTKKLLKKNKTFLESTPPLLIISENKLKRNIMKQEYDSYFSKTNYKVNNSNLHMSKINSSFSIKSNDSQYNLIRNNNTNYSSKMTQTSISFLNDINSKNNSKNNSKSSVKKENIVNFEINLDNNNKEIKKVNYIDLHINQILSKEDEIKKKKMEIIKKKINNKKTINNISNCKPIPLNIINHFISNSYKNFNNNLIQISTQSQLEKRINTYKEKNPVNYVNFKKELDNLFHKIKVIEKNKEFEDFVISLTDEELNYVLSNMNKNILPILITNRDNKNFINLNQSSYDSEDKLKMLMAEESKRENTINIKAYDNQKNSMFDNEKDIKNNNNINNNIYYNVNNNTNINNNINNDNNNNINTNINNIINNNTNINNNINNNFNSNNNINNIINGIINNNFNNNNNNTNNINNYKLFPQLLFNSKININRSINKKFKIIEKTKDNNNNIEKNEIKRTPIVKNAMKHTVQNTNKNTVKKNSHKNITYTKLKLKQKESEIKKEPSIKEDLNFLINSNKLNWDLINDKDKKRGEVLWNKIINSKNSNTKIKNKYKRTKSFVVQSSNKLNKRNALILDMPEILEENKKLSKSGILETNVFTKEHNERKRKYSLELCSSINMENNDSIYDGNIKMKQKNKFSLFNKINKKKYKKQSKKKSKKKKKNIDIYTNSYIDYYYDSEDEENSNESYTHNNNNKLFLKKLNIGDKKDFYFNNYNISSSRSKTSSNKKKQDYIQNSLKNLKKFLLEKYKVSDSSINLNIQKDNIKDNKIKSAKNKKQKENNNKKNEDIKDIKIIIEMPEIIINLFGFNVRVKNIKTALKDYMKKRKVTLTQLYRQIEIKNKLSKLIIQLEKEKKERRRKRRKTKKITILDIRSRKNLLQIFENYGQEKNIEPPPEQKEKDSIEIKKEMEKRKMRLLLKFKNDIDYKIMKGEIKKTDVDIDIFTKLQEKIDKMMDSYNEDDFQQKMEDYLGDFEEELELIEQKKHDEKRINEFIENLRYQVNLKLLKKKKIQEKFCNAVNYESVNHMNILNKID